MKFSTFLFLPLVCLLSIDSSGQSTDTLIKKLDSLHVQADSAGFQHNNISEDAYNYNTKLNGRTYFTLLASNLKQVITRPFHMKGKDWLKFGVFGAITATLTLADEPIQHYAVKLNEHNDWLKNISHNVTRFGGIYEGVVLVGLGTTGFIIKNQKLKTTTLLATQSYLTTAIISPILKQLVGRQRPNVYDPGNSESEPKFHGPSFNGGKDINGKRLNSSFPSGHATAAFSAATVFAMEYRGKPLVPIIAYSAATLIGLSRITENKHWFTDVFVGAMFGYLTGRQVVNNYHRFAKIREDEKKKNTITFNLQYNNRIIMPGLVYKFR